MKYEGHTHTEFCPHGSGEDVELMIERAIKMGFTHYSITEHPPLPTSFKEMMPNTAAEIATTAMDMNDVEHYIKKIKRLQYKYQSDLTIRFGFELDYLPENTDDVRNFLNEYGPYLSDNILSVHFMPGKDGWRFIDYSAADFDSGLVQHYGSFPAVQNKYIQMQKEALSWDIGQFKPTRLGHLSLVQKFQKNYTPAEIGYSLKQKHQLSCLLDQIASQNYSLDFNTAGLYKVDCGETYPGKELTRMALAKGIPFVFGSDAHSVDEVGRGYDKFIDMYR